MDDFAGSFFISYVTSNFVTRFDTICQVTYPAPISH